MNTYKNQYTEKFPFRYFAQSGFYCISTCSESKYNELVKQIEEMKIQEFSIQQINNLLKAGFTVVTTK